MHGCRRVRVNPWNRGQDRLQYDPAHSEGFVRRLCSDPEVLCQGALILADSLHLRVVLRRLCAHVGPTVEHYPRSAPASGVKHAFIRLPWHKHRGYVDIGVALRYDVAPVSHPRSRQGVQWTNIVGIFWRRLQPGISRRISALSIPRQMAQCCSNAWVSRGSPVPAPPL